MESGSNPSFVLLFAVSRPIILNGLAVFLPYGDNIAGQVSIMRRVKNYTKVPWVAQSNPDSKYNHGSIKSTAMSHWVHKNYTLGYFNLSLGNSGSLKALLTFTKFP